MVSAPLGRDCFVAALLAMTPDYARPVMLSRRLAAALALSKSSSAKP
jgi:hypothetical protein